MKQIYSNTPVHTFIREFVESEKGEVKDISEEYFTIKLPSTLKPIKYTYKPAIASEQKIDLIATGSPAFNGIIDECLNDGVIGSAKIINKTKIEDALKKFFKDNEYHCDESEKITINKKDHFICTHIPACFHRINNAKIESIKIINRLPINLYLFVYSIFWNNKLKKNEEIISVLLNKNGEHIDADLLNDENIDLVDTRDQITLTLFDTLNASANELIDSILKNKKQVFDLQLKKEINQKIVALEKKLDDDRLQKKISKKWKFNEEEWKLKKDHQLSKEKDSLDTFISVKFLNFLCLTTEKITYEIVLSNKSKIKSSFVLGVDKYFSITCSSCGKEHSEGYATEDKKYLCIDCINQSLDSKEIYSKDYTLIKDNTTKEFIENDSGFKCSVCNKKHSNKFLFKCNQDQSRVCLSCFDFCTKCDDLFSTLNLTSSKESKKLFCSKHIMKCDNCKKDIGMSEVKQCLSTGKKVCSCTKFNECSLCNQMYSEDALTNGKCAACNGLNEEHNSKLISIITKHDSKQSKTKKWLVGYNKLNIILIAKGFISDKLFVVHNNKVSSEKKLSIFNKLKGYSK